jgi:hypothetical protein
MSITRAFRVCVKTKKLKIESTPKSHFSEIRELFIYKIY